MGTRHKHADVIIAWANGETVQQFNGEDGDTTYWVEWNNTCGITPAFDYGRWRVKPKRVKREGWVNVYGEFISGGAIHPTKELAIAWASHPITATVRIEWEEEE